MNLLFLSDTLGIEGPVIRQVFLEYMKLDSNLTSFNFFNNIKILEDISNDKYIVFYDTFNGVEAFEKMINDESHI